MTVLPLWSQCRDAGKESTKSTVTLNQTPLPTWVMPAGCSLVRIKIWGAGGGAGAGGRDSGSTGGSGGPGGYVSLVVALRSGDSLDYVIGGGGSGGIYRPTDGGSAGGGGGLSGVRLNSAWLAVAGGGGGGGGAGENSEAYGGNGGAGGGTDNSGLSKNNGTAGKEGHATNSIGYSGAVLFTSFYGRRGNTTNLNLAGPGAPFNANSPFTPHAGGRGGYGKAPPNNNVPASEYVLGGAGGLSGTFGAGGTGGAYTEEDDLTGGGGGGSGYHGGGGGSGSVDEFDGGGSGGGGGSSFINSSLPIVLAFEQQTGSDSTDLWLPPRHIDIPVPLANLASGAELAEHASDGGDGLSGLIIFEIIR